MSSPFSNCTSHSVRAQDFSSHQFPERKYGPRCSMIFPEISALRTCARVSSSNKSDADTAGRNLRRAGVECAVLSAWESEPVLLFCPLATSSFAAATADVLDDTVH